MKVIYLYNNDTDRHRYSIHIEAWAYCDALYNSDGKVHKTFTRLEKMDIHVFLESEQRDYHICDFEHDFGRDGCTGHHAKTIQEFLFSMADTRYHPLHPITAASYNRVKRLILKTYAQYPPVDFEAYIEKRRKQKVTILF